MNNGEAGEKKVNIELIFRTGGIGHKNIPKKLFTNNERVAE